MYLLCVNVIESCEPLNPADSAELDEASMHYIYESIVGLHHSTTKGLERKQQIISVSE